MIKKAKKANKSPKIKRIIRFKPKYPHPKSMKNRKRNMRKKMILKLNRNKKIMSSKNPKENPNQSTNIKSIPGPTSIIHPIKKVATKKDIPPKKYLYQLLNLLSSLFINKNEQRSATKGT